MITQTEYFRAKDIVAKYEMQHGINSNQPDINLLDVLSTRARNALLKYNKMLDDTKENRKDNREPMIYVSDVVKEIIKDNRKMTDDGDRYLAVIKIKGLGRKSYLEIMEYVYPFL